jgi:hypothetical protein
MKKVEPADTLILDSEGDYRLRMVPLNDEGRYFCVHQGTRILSRWSNLANAHNEFLKLTKGVK